MARLLFLLLLLLFLLLFLFLLFPFLLPAPFAFPPQRQQFMVLCLPQESLFFFHLSLLLSNVGAATRHILYSRNFHHFFFLLSFCMKIHLVKLFFFAVSLNFLKDSFFTFTFARNSILEFRFEEASVFFSPVRDLFSLLYERLDPCFIGLSILRLLFLSVSPSDPPYA